jgi:ribosome-associated translation inhibitor RaiA
MDEDQKKTYQQPGIESDTTGNSELSNWILTSRKAQLGLHGKLLDIAIKGDKKELYPVINTIITTLEKQKLFKFSLITDLKKVPKK